MEKVKLSSSSRSFEEIFSYEYLEENLKYREDGNHFLAMNKIPVEIEIGLNNNFQIFRNIFKNLSKYSRVLFAVPDDITQNIVLQ